MRIRQMRRMYELTQEQVAKYLKMHQNSYSHYETGENRVPVDVLEKLADLYGTSVDYLLERTDEKKPYSPCAEKPEENAVLKLLMAE
ncbi:MAG: helix-turn-helix domain-containing protein [Clostridiales bacterium]|nr:helix-turn-helix domain-containing protein [Clostridiales bacterium]